MPDGCQGDRVSSKSGAVRGPPKRRFGDRAFSSYKNRHFRGKVWQQQKKAKSHKLPPLSQELCFVETHTWICARGTCCETSLTGCCPYKNRFVWGSHCARVVRMYQFENICVCKKCLLSAFCKVLCFDLLECLFLQFNSVLGCARFSARFLTREQFGNICVSK